MTPNVPKRKLNFRQMISDGIKIIAGLATAGFIYTHMDFKEGKVEYENNFVEIHIFFKLGDD